MIHSHHVLAGDLHAPIKAAIISACARCPISLESWNPQRRAFHNGNRTHSRETRPFARWSAQKYDVRRHPSQCSLPQNVNGNPIFNKANRLRATLSSPTHRSKSTSSIPQTRPPPRPPRAREVNATRSVLRTSSPHVGSLEVLESPDDERRRLEEIAKAAREYQEEEEAARQAKLHREYRLLVLQPIETLENRYQTIKSSVPSSKADVIAMITAAKVKAHSSWHDRYKNEVEIPIAQWSRSLDAVQRALATFREESVIVLRRSRTEAESDWRLMFIHTLDTDASEIERNLLRIDSDLAQHEKNITALQRAVLVATEEAIADIDEAKTEGLHAKSRKLGFAYRRAVVETLYQLSDTRLLRVKQELVQRGRWGLYDPGSPFSQYSLLWGGFEHDSASSKTTKEETDEPWRSKLDANFLKGADSLATQRALCYLLLVRTSLLSGIGDIQLLLHIWRQHDLNLTLLKRVPYLATYRVVFAKLDILYQQLHSLSVENVRIVKDTFTLCIMAGTTKKTFHRYDRIYDLLLAVRRSTNAADHLFHRDFLRGLSPLMLNPMSLLERSLASRFRPILTYISSCRELSATIDQVRYDLRHLRRHYLMLSTLKTEWDYATGHLVRACSTGITWSGAFDLYFGVSSGTSLHGNLEDLQSADSGPHELGLQPAEWPGSIEKSKPSALYPMHTPIEVHYGYDDRDTFFAYRLLRNCRTLALDAISVEYLDDAGVKTSRLEFIMLASENVIAIAHIGQRAHLKIQSMAVLRGILEDSKIVKIGVNLESVTRHISQQLDCEVSGCLNLAGDDDIMIDLDDGNAHAHGQAHGVLSRLTAQYLGSSLPELKDVKALLNAGMSGVSEYFHYLAARALAPLHIHKAHQTATTMEVSRLQWHQACQRLGPIVIGTVWDTFVRHHVRNHVRDPVKFKRPSYLYRLSLSLASSVLDKQRILTRQQLRTPRAKLTKRLQTYFLVTTFNEPFEDVRRILSYAEVFNASDEEIFNSVSSVAQLFGLPFHPNHRKYLYDAMSKPRQETEKVGQRRKQLI